MTANPPSTDPRILDAEGLCAAAEPPMYGPPPGVGVGSAVRTSDGRIGIVVGLEYWSGERQPLRLRLVWLADGVEATATLRARARILAASMEAPVEIVPAEGLIAIDLLVGQEG